MASDTKAEDAYQRIGRDIADAGDFRRVLAHIASTPMEGEPNFDGPLVPADARRFVKMARQILEAHPEIGR